jgi:hypothetical protein
MEGLTSVRWEASVSKCKVLPERSSYRIKPIVSTQNTNVEKQWSEAPSVGRECPGSGHVTSRIEKCHVFFGRVAKIIFKRESSLTVFRNATTPNSEATSFLSSIHSYSAVARESLLSSEATDWLTGNSTKIHIAVRPSAIFL